MSDMVISNLGTARVYAEYLRNCKASGETHPAHDKMKRALREFYQRKPRDVYETVFKGLEYNPTGSKIIRGDCDGYTQIIRFDKELTEEEAEFVDDSIRMVYRPTYYDCTGQLFTSWISVYRIPGKTVVEHRVSCDV